MQKKKSPLFRNLSKNLSFETGESNATRFLARLHPGLINKLIGYQLKKRRFEMSNFVAKLKSQRDRRMEVVTCPNCNKGKKEIRLLWIFVTGHINCPDCKGTGEIKQFKRKTALGLVLTVFGLLTALMFIVAIAANYFIY